MGLRDKIKHAVESAKGKAKEAVGKAQGDDSLEAEGQVDQTVAFND